MAEQGSPELKFMCFMTEDWMINYPAFAACWGQRGESASVVEL